MMKINNVKCEINVTVNFKCDEIIVSHSKNRWEDKVEVNSPPVQATADTETYKNVDVSVTVPVKISADEAFESDIGEIFDEVKDVVEGEVKQRMRSEEKETSGHCEKCPDKGVPQKNDSGVPMGFRS